MDKKIKSRNTIIYLGTGRGETLIAIMVIRHFVIFLHIFDFKLTKYHHTTIIPWISEGTNHFKFYLAFHFDGVASHGSNSILHLGKNDFRIWS